MNVDPTTGMQQLQKVLKCVTLRRLKDMVDPDGNPIVDLPDKSEEIRVLPLTSDEQAHYNAIYEETALAFNRLSEMSKCSHIVVLGLCMKLRLSCCHIELGDGDAPSKTARELEDLQNAIVTRGITVDRAGKLYRRLLENGEAHCSSDLCTDRDICAAPPDSVSGRLVMTRCMHLLCDECYSAIAFVDGAGACPSCSTSLDPHDVVEVTSSEADTVSCEKGCAITPTCSSTKICSLLADLKEISRGNPLSVNHVRDDKTSEDSSKNGVIKSVVLYVSKVTIAPDDMIMRVLF